MVAYFVQEKQKTAAKNLTQAVLNAPVEKFGFSLNRAG